MKTTRNIETVLKAYIECALWSSTSDDGEPLDSAYDIDDISTKLLAEMREEVADFVALTDDIDTSEWTDEQFGHDFWLTRNRHGAGFWDRGRDSGASLTKLAYPYGTCDLYVGENGKIYQ